jgi:hypothetical protein
MIKVVFSSIMFIFASASTCFGQSAETVSEAPATEEIASEETEAEEVFELGEEEDEEEIENFDFLYAGENYNYDQVLIDNLVTEAYKHIGARYRYGSKGPNTFDCSGFTSYVYKQSNMNIGASSRDQYARNKPIKRSELQPGDLVFFTSPGSRKGVGHVGIVIDYDPVSEVFTFIHASTKAGVKISKSSEPNYTRRYVGARRVQ